MVIGEGDTAPGFIFGPRHNRRHPAKVLSDTDFADDIVLLSNTINQARGYCTELNQHVIQMPCPLSQLTQKQSMLHSALTAPTSKGSETISDQRQSDGSEPNLNA